VADLNFALEVVVCDTMRETDGLAMSSRNVRVPLPKAAGLLVTHRARGAGVLHQVYLSAEERKRAPILHKALSAGRDRYLAGERSAKEIIRYAPFRGLDGRGYQVWGHLLVLTL
jgi:pantoate--beta-alanine ligase